MSKSSALASAPNIPPPNTTSHTHSVYLIAWHNCSKATREHLEGSSGGEKDVPKALLRMNSFIGKRAIYLILHGLVFRGPGSRPQIIVLGLQSMRLQCHMLELKWVARKRITQILTLHECSTFGEDHNVKAGSFGFFRRAWRIWINKKRPFKKPRFSPPPKKPWECLMDWFCIVLQI